MRKPTVAVLATTLALGLLGAAPELAVARSYTANAVNKANHWAYNHYPSALYIQSECYPGGYHLAYCQIVLTKTSSECSVNVTVSGSSYYIRRTDSTC